MLYNAKQLTLTIENTINDYISFGTGTKNLIMIQGLNTNGISGSAIALATMYRMFAKDYKVYLFDRRRDISDNITVRELASHIAEAMDALDIRTADIFGVSQGGMIAQYLAIDRPDLVNKLVLAVTSSKNNETITAVIENWIHMTEKEDWKNLISDMALKMYSDTYMNRYKMMMPLLTAMQKPKDPKRFVTLAKACFTCNTYEELNKIKCPVFVIGGTKDKIVTGEASKEIAEKLGCEIYMYEDLGHAAYEEAKDFNQKVLGFLNS